MKGMLRKASVRIRSALPEAMRTPVKEVVLGWGKVTARWRMTPGFIVVGAQRCGTTSLFRVLSDHPDVVRPTASKGIGYFDVHHRLGRRWYAAHFPLRFGRESKTTFESSGYYAFHPLSIERIARELPGVKLILMVRDPVERAYSAHRHESARGFETLDFPDAIQAEPARLAGEAEKMMADPAYESFDHRHHAYVGRGLYADQLDRMTAAVGRDRIHVVDADRLFAQPETELSALFSWLGLRAWLPDTFEQWNARPRDPMADDTRSSLAARFEDSDRRLADYLGRPPSWREEVGEPVGEQVGEQG